MESTTSFRDLDGYSKQKLKDIYVNYFFKRQDDFWKKEAMHKLPSLKRSTNMLVCGEDLGMVPECVPDVMHQLGMLSLEIQRMPKDPKKEFFHPADAPYMSVVTPSTHDMSTIRGWWEEDPAKTQYFYNNMLGRYGAAPFFCEPRINREILIQHLYSPAMWCIFQVQDILGMSKELRRENPNDERINVPADPKHYWRYRMHISIEDLIKQDTFNREFGSYITASKR
jgi:4-alpha-glucanotransferase